MSYMEFIGCPDRTCDAPAEVVDRSWWPSTVGLIPHVATHCAAGHRYYGPEER